MPNLRSVISLNAQGDQVKAVQANLSKIGGTLPPTETAAATFGAGTADAVTDFQDRFKLPVTGTIDPVTQAMLTNAAAVAGTNQSSVSGRLVLDNGLPGQELTMRLYNIVYGGVATKLAEAKTDANGVYSLPYTPPAGGASVEVRVVNAQGQETTVSSIIYNALEQQVLNLVAPAKLQPALAEFQRLSTDIQSAIGGSGIQNLATAQETDNRQDLTLLTQSTGWDARLLALAATAAQQAAPTGLGSDVLYALYRAGLPTDQVQLALTPPATISDALNQATQAGVSSFTAQQVAAATTAFQGFATKIQLTLTPLGGLSNFGALFQATGITDPIQHAGFTALVFNQPESPEDFWDAAAKLGIPDATLTGLQTQGKVLQLTQSNLALTQHLSNDLGPAGDLSQLAEKDYHEGATWKTALTGLAGTGGTAALNALIPSAYLANASNPLEAYAADMALNVRLSYPTHTVARLIETGTLGRTGQFSPAVATFLRAAAAQGYQLGQTPLTSFLQKAQATPPTLPALSTGDVVHVKTLHRLYQVTPSNESLQAALQQGFTCARDIAAYSRSDFMAKFGPSFPSLAEADLVCRKAQQVSAVAFNTFTLANGLDKAAVYSISSPPATVQAARNSIIEQFPSLQTLFGSTDFRQCDDCQSVLSPAAYFVDLLEFLRAVPPAAENSAGYTPLDVLIGKDASVPGRRPDLAALPLSCANTETALPYIDIVNEILEYYITHPALDAGLAHDTGTASTDDLVAEPQNILPAAYSILLKADAQFGFPLGLPFDLWLETVRGFYNYLKTPLAQALKALQPIDPLPLFAPTPAPANPPPYYQCSIFAEALGLSPSESALFTNADPLANWFQLYGYPTEDIALQGGTYPPAPNFTYAPLSSAKCLAQYLGVTYQELTDLLTTGFLNPSLAAISFQFERFGLDLARAFSYRTSQPGGTQAGFSALAGTELADFQATLTGITQRYSSAVPAFDAGSWLESVLPANYSRGVLVLDDPGAGCDFAATTLQYADGTPAGRVDFLKFNLFVRLWKKLGWTMDETDRALQLFFAEGGGLPPIFDFAPGSIGSGQKMPPRAQIPPAERTAFGQAFSAAWQTALVYLAHLDDLASQWQPALGRVALLPLWAPLATTGENPLYAQIFLTPAILNTDPAFDDPLGQFPSAKSDPLLNHQPGIQGALGLSATEVAAILADAGPAVTTVAASGGGQVPSFSLANLSLLYRYGLMASCLNLSVEDFIALKGMAVDLTSLASAVSGLNPFTPPTGNPITSRQSDLLCTQTLQFVQQAGVVAGSGFTVEDLRYLLLHAYDPLGEYQADQNALLTLVQSLAAGLQQIQAANAVSSDLTGLSDDLIQQKLSSLFPAPFLTALSALLSNAAGFTATQTGVAPGGEIDPGPFAGEPELSFSYDKVQQIQTLTYKGVLLDAKKAALLQINGTPLFAGLLGQLAAQVKGAWDAMVGNLLGVWASLVQYEAAVTVAAPIAFPAPPGPPPDAALQIGYDADNKVQWLTYRGVLTGAKMSALTAFNNSPDFAKLLAGIEAQSLPAFNKLLGLLLGCWANLLTYVVTQTGVAPGNQLDPALLAAFPQVAVSYDPTAQVQTLSCQGVWTTSMQNALQAAQALLSPAPAPAAVTLLANLLQAARSQALNFVQAQAANWAVVASADLDSDSLPYASLDPSKMLKLAKGTLVQVFSPLLAQKLSRQLVVQTLAGNLGSDPSLTGALVTDAGLLADPAKPGHSLLGALLSLQQPGVTATYYTSANQTGPALTSATALTAATTDPSNPNPATVASVHYEGYLQVSTDGPYRFFAELGNAGAQVRFGLGAPPSATAIANPVLPTYTATKAADETSQFVDLQGGIAYHFTLDFLDLGAGGSASLLIQGEILPKGPLSQVQLYPAAAVQSFSGTKILLSKALQLIEGTALDETEVAYLTAHAAEFADFKLSALPTQPSNDPAPVAAVKAGRLFAQFLTLADYADLRRGPAGASDGLIAIFQSVNQPFTEVTGSGSTNKNQSAPWTILGNLTRRDPQVVRELAIWFGLIQQSVNGANTQLTAVNDFANNRGIRRLWQALQVVQTLGLPVAVATASTGIVSTGRNAISPDPGQGIAGNLRDAVKAQSAVEVWRPVAKSVFDPLRQKKRDALVAYTVRQLQLASEEQLFEYFLVDPGMEPVVQTSRLRLALSSVQTFIERCLLNLENGNTQNPKANVAPSAIQADWWAWMKRYRVWQANRKIFLYPENWLEPELRTDKTDLFETLAGALLQGDITNDLAESAFYGYLQGLDLRARLDIVATYLEQTGPQDMKDLMATDDILHVVGRTHGQPPQYFYRTFANGIWTPWAKVTASIEGDHLVIAKWRNRVNLFWVTFQPISKPGPMPTPDPKNKKKGQSVSDMDFATLAGHVTQTTAQQVIRVQLNWSEYFQGQWSKPLCSDASKYDPVELPAGAAVFDASCVFIHTSQEPSADGIDGPLLIHLDFPTTRDYGPPLKQGVDRGSDIRSFRLTSKNCHPEFARSGAAALFVTVRDTMDLDATGYVGGSQLSTGFPSHTSVYLRNLKNFELVPCSNPVSLPLLANESATAAGGYAAPFFYKDLNLSESHPLYAGTTRDECTFFVQPQLVTTAHTRWLRWAEPPKPDRLPGFPDGFRPIMTPQASANQRATLQPGAVDPRSTLFHLQGVTDHITAPEAAISYGSALIGAAGRLQPLTLNARPSPAN